MSHLSDVLSRLSDEINMQEDLAHERCVPINRSSRLSESPYAVQSLPWCPLSMDAGSRIVWFIVNFNGTVFEQC